MDDLTCPNCNVDVAAQELKQNFLRCPTCGFDMSDISDDDTLVESDEDEDDETDSK